MMDVRQLEYFMTVFEHASFTKAAKQLNVVQPALSMQIRRLEKELRVELFERTPRGLYPTKFGKQVYALCSPIIGDLAAAKQRIWDMATSVRISGSVRCGFPTPLFKEIVPKAVLSFNRQYPDVELTMSDSYSDTLKEWVRTNQLDFAFGAWSEDDVDIIKEATIEEQVVLVSGRPLGKPYESVDLSRLRGLKLLIPTAGSTTGPLFKTFVAKGTIRPSQTITINSYLGVLEVARMSDWCGIVPVSGVIAEAEKDELFLHPVAKPKFSFKWNLIHGKRTPISIAGRRFVEMILAGFDDVNTRWKRIVTERTRR